eukprot:365475-Karenia_brevis.AAC.1
MGSHIGQRTVRTLSEHWAGTTVRWKPEQHGLSRRACGRPKKTMAGRCASVSQIDVDDWLQISTFQTQWEELGDVFVKFHRKP